MKKTKLKVMLVVLMSGVLFAGSITVQANSLSRVIGDYVFMAETCAYDSGSAMSRTVSNSYEVNTSVRSEYTYSSSNARTLEIIEKYDSGAYGSYVTFTRPAGDIVPLDVHSDHTVSCTLESWSGSTGDEFP